MPKKLILKNTDPLAEHWSSWLVTINSNSTNKKLIGPLKVIWKYITKNMIDFTYAKHDGTTYVEVGQKSNIEIGEAQHRVHLHGQIITNSNGIVFLDYRKIKALIDKQLERFDTFGGCHFNAQLVRNFNASVAIQAYIDKEPVEADDNESDFDIIL